MAFDELSRTQVSSEDLESLLCTFPGGRTGDHSAEFAVEKDNIRVFWGRGLLHVHPGMLRRLDLCLDPIFKVGQLIGET